MRNHVACFVALLGLVWPVGMPALAVSLPELVTPEVDRAVKRGLDYLASRQNNDFWSSRHGNVSRAAAAHPYPVYHTGLCGLVLMQSGSTPHEGPYADHLMRATTYLMNTAQDDGFIAAGEGGGRSMYGHGMAMLFLSQVYGMLHDTGLQQRLRDVLTRAVAFSSRYQTRNGGWAYTPRSDGEEGSVAITQIHALRACHNAGIPVAKSTMARFIAYLEVLEAPDGGLVYTTNDRRPGGALKGVTTAGAASFFLAGATEHPLGRRLRQWVSSHANAGLGPADNVVGHVDYVRFCTSTALFLWDDEQWPDYYRGVCGKLLPRQQDDGAWVTERMGDIYGTAMALYALQLPYRQLPILQQ